MNEYRTMKMWNDFHKMTTDFFDSITIADLLNAENIDNYVI